MRFQTWDFGGDLSLGSDVNFAGHRIPLDLIFKNCSTLVYVIDAQEEDYFDALPKMVETISTAYEINEVWLEIKIFFNCVYIN